MKKLLRTLGIQKRSRPIIVVSGLPRSGTSLMMKMLEAGGVALLTDQMRRADADNPQGYYEFERVKMLPEGDHAWLPDATGKAVKIIFALLPFLPPNYMYKMIFMRRSMPEILASQRRMLLRNNRKPEEIPHSQMQMILEKHMHEVYTALENKKNIAFMEISYNELMTDAMVPLRRLQPFLGRELALKQMAAVINPKLYRQRAKQAT